MPGHVLTNGKCEPCGSNFATCVNATNGTTCMNGFYKASITECIACPSPARSCSSAKTFTSCLDTYYPTAVTGNEVSCTKCPTAGYVVNCVNATFATSC